METENTHGIILRTSCNFFGRYAYFPLPQYFPNDAASNFDNICTNSLTNAPHFPDITILDSVSSNILYQTYNSFPYVFHIYNLINRSYFAFSFPYHLTFVTAAILICGCSHFKVLVVCINEHPNPLFTEQGGNRNKPLVFYLYTSNSENWSLVPIDYDLTSNHLLPNRRNPAHAGENTVYLDLINHFLVTYAYWEEKIELIPKFVSIWEKELMHINNDTRYFQSSGHLHCVKFNPIKVRFEVYIWMEQPKGLWRLVAEGEKRSTRAKVLGIHPDDAGYLFLRTIGKDDISLVNIRQNFSHVIIDEKGPICTAQCFVNGMNDVLEDAISEGVRSLSCGILHPHENIEGPAGEVFIISRYGSQLVLPPQNIC
ncbi:hypothetical protein MA16_Dca007972 [Dendrobium catenatum]|uniref:Uncharacterized protein n=1 Tax=Dendrobium catenatum TaxID=906689 RepID=A0A2I0VKY0_9ASPA|nr:hypothetical protein MA16_Dca007972 [Dendrobium catenatum]